MCAGNVTGVVIITTNLYGRNISHLPYRRGSAIPRRTLLGGTRMPCCLDTSVDLVGNGIYTADNIGSLQYSKVDSICKSVNI